MNSILPIEELPERDHAARDAARELSDRTQKNVLLHRRSYGYDLYIVYETIPANFIPAGRCYLYTHDAPTRA